MCIYIYIYIYIHILYWPGNSEGAVSLAAEVWKHTALRRQSDTHHQSNPQAIKLSKVCGAAKVSGPLPVLTVSMSYLLYSGFLLYVFSFVVYLISPMHSQGYADGASTKSGDLQSEVLETRVLGMWCLQVTSKDKDDTSTVAKTWKSCQNAARRSKPRVPKTRACYTRVDVPVANLFLHWHLLLYSCTILQCVGDTSDGERPLRTHWSICDLWCVRV